MSTCERFACGLADVLSENGLTTARTPKFRISGSSVRYVIFVLLLTGIQIYGTCPKQFHLSRLYVTMSIGRWIENFNLDVISNGMIILSGILITRPELVVFPAIAREFFQHFSNIWQSSLFLLSVSIFKSVASCSLRKTLFHLSLRIYLLLPVTYL